ncbi:MAG: sensor histidine kinase [Thermotogaceae bacterium]|nr:sensor histidine kinase [Thermotogaceae bacterium]
MGLKTLSDHIMDIFQNALVSGASKIHVTIEESDSWFAFTVSDNGKGMTEDFLKKVFDPFITTRDSQVRRVGLGLPFLKQAAEMTGGRVSLESSPGKGTKVRASFNMKHVDCQPVGDIAGTLAAIVLSNNSVEITVSRKKKDFQYQLSNVELRETLGNLSNPVVMKAVFDIFKELESELADELS